MGGRPEPGVHVVGGPPPGQASLSSQGLHAGLEPGPSMAPRDPKRPRMADLPPLRIETREAKVNIILPNSRKIFSSCYRIWERSNIVIYSTLLSGTRDDF